MTMSRAFFTYRIEATAGEQLRALKARLGAIAIELVDLGLTLDEVEDALDEALAQARDEHDVLESLKR